MEQVVLGCHNLRQESEMMDGVHSHAVCFLDDNHDQSLCDRYWSLSDPIHLSTPNCRFFLTSQCTDLDIFLCSSDGILFKVHRIVRVNLWPIILGRSGSHAPLWNIVSSWSTSSIDVLTTTSWSLWSPFWDPHRSIENCSQIWGFLCSDKVWDGDEVNWLCLRHELRWMDILQCCA